MRISISNIAWELGDEDAIAGQLRDSGIALVDIAPGKYFPEPERAGAADIAVVRRLWADRGFAIEGMQALLFGTTGLNLFDDPDDVMLDRLSAICRIGGELGVRALTFGSPRQRDRAGLDDAATTAMAQRFFGRLGDRAAQAGVIVCLEPNPAAYGCNFMVSTLETRDVVAAIDHPAIRMQLDTGALAMNQEDPASTIAAVAPWVGHIHASEPQLAVLNGTSSVHSVAGEAIRQVLPQRVVTIEMAPSPDLPAPEAVARAVAVAQRHYGDAA